MSDMPESDEDVSKWCKDIFVAKVFDYFVKLWAYKYHIWKAPQLGWFVNYFFQLQDALLDKHIATGSFDEEIRPIGRPIVFAGKYLTKSLRRHVID